MADSPDTVIVSSNQHQRLGSGPRGPHCCGRKCTCALNVLTAVIYSFYYTFLVWLLSHVESNTNYYALISLPLLCDIMLLVIFIRCHSYDTVVVSLQAFRITAVVLTLMSTFTLLTRHAFYHASDNSFIGTNFIIISLKGSVIVFLWDLLSQRNFDMQRIAKDKDVITRIILDNVDIFNMVEVLLMPTVAADSTLEKVIQTFCTLSFSICWAETLYVCVTEYEHPHPLHLTFSVVYYVSIFLQNVPFFIIRLYAWIRHDIFSLGFIVKNLLAIVFGMAEIFAALRMQSFRGVQVQ